MNRYQAYMLSPAWQIRRREYWRTHRKRACRACGAKRGLHLHHKTYVRLGRERSADLVFLCAACHKAVHRRYQRSDKTLWTVTEQFIRTKRRRSRTRV